MLLAFTSPQLGKFQAVGKKAIFEICIKVELAFCGRVEGVEVDRVLWPMFFPGRQLKVLVQAVRYEADSRPPAEGRARGESHKQIPSTLGSTIGEWYFCCQAEILEHFVFSVSSALFDLLKEWFQGLRGDFSFILFIFDPKYCTKKKAVLTLVKFVSDSTKSVIWLTQKKRARGAGSKD